MPPIPIRCHGVNYIRTGECIRCGECCSSKNCLHFSWADGLAACDIQGNKKSSCRTCMEDKDAYFFKPGRIVTHEICAIFPNHPFLRVITSGVCGYTFKPATVEDEMKHQKLQDAKMK